MRFTNGWVKVSRKLLSHEWSQCLDVIGKGVLLELLLMANIQPTRCLQGGKVRILERGQMVVGLRKLAETLIIDRGTLMRRLEVLKQLGTIELETSHEGTIITICNYDKYQVNKNDDEPQTNHECYHERTTGATPIEELKNIRIKEHNTSSDDGAIVAKKRSRKPKDPIDKNFRHPLMDLWNAHCGTLPTVVAMTKTRLPQCKKRLEDNPDLGYWEMVIKKMAECDWCNGNTGKAWRANFDYFLQDETNVKYLEGNFDNRSTNQTNSPNHGLRVL